MPSWQFFREIAPSPRIEFCLSQATEAEAATNEWRELSLRPQSLSIISSIKSLFFNPNWNEALYIMNCAESLVINPTEYNSQELMRRIKARLEQDQVEIQTAPYLQFRLVFVSRNGTELQKDILYISEISRIAGDEEA